MQSPPPLVNSSYNTRRHSITSSTQFSFSQIYIYTHTPNISFFLFARSHTTLFHSSTSTRTLPRSTFASLLLDGWTAAISSFSFFFFHKRDRRNVCGGGCRSLTRRKLSRLIYRVVKDWRIKIICILFKITRDRINIVPWGSIKERGNKDGVKACFCRIMIWTMTRIL